MAEWLFDSRGRPRIIAAGECFRSHLGKIIGWVHDGSAYSLRGRHLGWYEDGVLYDRKNRAVGLTYGATGWLPFRPGLSGTPGMPGFSGEPGWPGFAGAPGRPGLGGWSDIPLKAFFG